MTKIIYAKPIHMHVKLYQLTSVCDTAISRSLWRANCKSARGKKSVGVWIHVASVQETFSRHDKTIFVVEGVHIVLSLLVTGFWDMTPHTVAQIYRLFGGTW